MNDQNKSPLGPEQVDRTSDDVRRGLCVGLRSENAHIIGAATELLTPQNLKALRSFPSTRFGILLSSHRCEALKIHTKGQKAIFIELEDDWTAAEISALADPTLDLTNPLRGPFKAEMLPELALEFEGFLKLMKISRLLPAAFIAFSENGEIKSFEGQTTALDNLKNYEIEKAQSLEIVARAKVPLKGSEDTTLVSFRPSTGGAEHLAILIESQGPNKTPLVRLHSECFTGDLLASLKCDCGDQLRGAIEKIAKEGGGALLYLAQEGRGVGLASKLKAYALQDQGFDTVDANTRLGFEVDERFFAPAAKMLGALNINSIRLLTNNPKKVEALETFGIEIKERVPHTFGDNPHNENYLKTKRDRTGHLL